MRRSQEEGALVAVAPQVHLVEYTPHPEQLIAAAAKLCYAKDPADLAESPPAGEEAEHFVQLLREMGHVSPIEHAAFTFYIEGVSRAMTHQLVRHRIASFSQRSQRYVPHHEFDYIVPPRLTGKKVVAEGGEIDAVGYFEETMQFLAERYRLLNAALGGKGESSQEDARYVLPNACETKIFVSMNARELLHFFEVRLCLRAQWEIRRVAEQMLELAQDACPAVFAGVGPKCIAYGKCPEGKMSCGRFREVQRRYARKPTQGRGQ
jgi:thymidylate synthase (FAD)